MRLQGRNFRTIISHVGMYAPGTSNTSWFHVMVVLLNSKPFQDISLRIR